MPAPLPIDPFLGEIVSTVQKRRALVITAAPGAGKTTRVPPALAAAGPVIVLQPRRVAARSIAKRIAAEQGWTIGREIGWHVRFERQFGPDVRVLLATEGILTARLQQDALLSGFTTIVLDEFHERTVHADLGIALAKQAWLARGDLRLVIMSATLDSSSVSSYLDDCPVIDVPGAPHPLEIRYTPELDVAAAVRVALAERPGDVLCFLPGAGEIARAARDLANPAVPSDVEVVSLHGSLPAAEQDAVLVPSSRRRVVLATNIAETSLTVPGVRVVIDSGLHKVARYDAGRAVDTLVTERVPTDAAVQRAGRAGRLGAGLALRLWDRSSRLSPHREPELARIDLSGPALAVLGWGGDPRTLDWLQAPAPERLDDAFRLLTDLGALASGRLTDIGRQMQRIPLHPRLARILVAGGGSREIALACALLSEPGPLRSGLPTAASTTSDLLSAIEREVPPGVERTARALQSIAGGGRAPGDDEFRRAVLAGYPDRVARRRAPGSARVLLASGHGGELSRESGVRDAEFLVALDVAGARPGERTEALVRMASAVERGWLRPTDVRTDVFFDDASGTARAEQREYYGSIVLTARPVAPPPQEAARLLATAYTARRRSDADTQLWRRLAFAGIELDEGELVRRAAERAQSLRDIDLSGALERDVRQAIDRQAPEWLDVPSGRRVRLEYREDGTVHAEVKLQEMFGLADTPRVGPRREPVVVSLLAPNGRPVQTTRDLRSFWNTTYAEVRKELRGRYPRHPWPEDPWSAHPTARTARRPR